MAESLRQMENHPEFDNLNHMSGQAQFLNFLSAKPYDSDNWPNVPGIVTQYTPRKKSEMR